MDPVAKDSALDAPAGTVREPGGSGPRIGRAIGGAAIIIMIGNLTSSVLGFVRAAVVGHVFGGTGSTDAFVAASIVPQMFYDLTIGAAVSAALIPTFTELIETREPGALWKTVGSVLALAWIALAVLVAILIAVAQPLMTAILSSFHAGSRPGDLEQSIRIVRIMVMSLFFLGTFAIFLSTLYSLRRFTAPAFAPSLYHLGIIGGALFLTRSVGILALPVGAVVGSFCQAASQIPSLLRSRPKIRIRPELTPEVRSILRLYLPVAIGLIVTLVGQVIDINLKWRLEQGGVLAMQNATTLTQFPIGIAVAALSFAVLPAISSDVTANRMEAFKDTVAGGIRLVLFLTIPTAIGYIALATPVVRLLFEHGAYSQQETARTALALTGYAVQIPFVGLDQLLIFSFYARKNTVTPMLVGVLGVLIYVASAIILLPHLHIFGLAIANTIQNSLHALILLVLLFMSIGTLSGRGVVKSVSQSIVAGLAMGAAAAGTSIFLGNVAGTAHLSGRSATVALPILVGVVVYLGMAAVLGSAELSTLKGFVREAKE